MADTATAGPARSWPAVAFLIIYNVGALATFGKLTFFDDYNYTWWNWIIVVPLNAMLAGMWPVYWLVVKPLFSLFS